MIQKQEVLTFMEQTIVFWQHTEKFCTSTIHPFSKKTPNNPTFP